jgi:hypothetical protein
MIVSQNSSVSMVTGYGPDSRGLIPGKGKRLFSTPQRPDRLWGSTHPPIQWVPGDLSPEVKRPGSEADHSPPSSAKAKNGGHITSLPHMS